MNEQLIEYIIGIVFDLLLIGILLMQLLIYRQLKKIRTEEKNGQGNIQTTR